MAIIKKSELKSMNQDSVKNRLTEIEKELMKLNAQRAIGTAIENPGKIRELRRSVAKLLTKNKIKYTKFPGGIKKV